MFGIPIPESPQDLKSLDPEDFARRVAALPGFARGMALRELRRWTHEIEKWREARDEGHEDRRRQLETNLAGELERWLGFTIPAEDRAEAVANLARCQQVLAREGIL